MRTIRLYHPEELTCGKNTLLKNDTSNHLVRVLRTNIGTQIILFNGDGYDYLCTTIDDHSKHTSVSVLSSVKTNKESNIHITLIQGLSRLDRMETTIQKSVELGVNKIIPVICQRSNVKLNKDKQLKKNTHWEKVAISACEQSGRNTIPSISEIMSLNTIHTELPKNAISITLNPEASSSLKEIVFEGTVNEICVFIGPEGGLNEEEINYLKEIKFQDVKFGPRILRTETAGPAVISAIQTLWGDF